MWYWFIASCTEDSCESRIASAFDKASLSIILAEVLKCKILTKFPFDSYLDLFFLALISQIYFTHLYKTSNIYLLCCRFLDNSNLTGTLPDALSSLTQLTSLWVRTIHTHVNCCYPSTDWRLLLHHCCLHIQESSMHLPNDFRREIFLKFLENNKHRAYKYNGKKTTVFYRRCEN